MEMQLQTQQRVTGRWWVLWLILVVPLLAIGCTESAGDSTTPKELIEETAPEPAEPSPPPAAPDTPADEQAPKADQQAPQAETPKIEVRTLDLRTSRALNALEKNFQGFMERQPLGFSSEFSDIVQHEFTPLIDRVQALPETLQTASPTELLAAGGPFLILVLFLAAFFILTRQIGGVVHQFQAEVHLELSNWLTRLIRGMFLIGGRTLAVALLLAASYFPVKAVFGPAPWTDVLTSTFWILVPYRLLSSTIVALFSGRILTLDEVTSRRLERMGVNGLRIVVGFLVALMVMREFDFHPEITSFAQFVFRLVLVTFPLYLYFNKETVLNLLPNSLDSRIFELFRRTLAHNYGAVMLTTAGLLAMRAAGYIRASTLILVRGYSLVLMVVLLFTVYRGLRRYLHSHFDVQGPVDDDPEGFEVAKQRRILSNRLEQLSGVGLLIIGIVGGLDLLLVLEPTLILLRTPFLAIGKVQLSVWILISLGLLVFGAFLATQLLRAFLNAVIYPVMEVDVGVAYAVNTIIKYVLVVLTFFLALAAIGVDLTAITVVIASLGIGIGFGLQTLVENLISGFILLFGRSVEKGDYITVEDTYGQVQAVGARSVIIRTPDNYEMLVPSKKIVDGRIINWSYDDNIVRTNLEVGVEYGSDPGRVREILLETTKKHPDVLREPNPSVWLTEFGDSSVNFRLLFFFNCRDTTEGRIVGELNYEVWYALEEAGVTIPFPQRDLHVKSDDTGRLNDQPPSAPEPGVSEQNGDQTAPLPDDQHMVEDGEPVDGTQGTENQHADDSED